MSDPGIALETVVEELRTKLYELTRSAKGQDLLFEVEGVEVELKVAVTKGGEGGVKASFWVLEVDGKGSYKTENTQTVKLKLKPRVPAEGDGPIHIGRSGRT